MLPRGAVLALLLAAPAAAQPLAFTAATLDPSASGDDKIVVDVDLDGDGDGVLGGSTLAWWESAGPARSFTERFLLDAAVELTTDIASGDVDGDGDPDLVYADGNGSGNVRWLENPLLSPPAGKDPDPTDGTDWTAHTIGTHGTWAHDLEVADLDGDTFLDVISMGNGEFRIYFGDGGASWDPRDFSAHGDDGAPSPAKIDADADLDLFLAGGWIEQPASDRRNPAGWTFHPIDGSDPGDGPASLALDVDGDGRPDLVTAKQHAAGRLAWFRNPADPTASGWDDHEISAAAASHHLRAADFDGDGRLDLLTGLELGAITVWRIHGATPTFTAYPVATSGGHNAAVGDLDRNGLPDVWAADYIGNPPLKVHWNGADLLFTDGFNGGDTGGWSAVSTP